MRELIINADDFGINERVTNEIERLIEDYAISSTTIMANGKCLSEVAAFSKQHPEVSFGAHICLSEFGSLTRSKVFYQYGLTDKEGTFIKQQIFKINNFDTNLLAAIKIEVLEQINVLLSYGIPLSHIDSHHHVHSIWGLHKLFEEVMQEKGFTKIRIARHECVYNRVRHPLRSMKRELAIRFYKSRFQTTGDFCSYFEYMKSPNSYKSDVVELMCHPGHEHFIEETRMVHEKKASLVSDRRLISYNDLQI